MHRLFPVSLTLTGLLALGGCPPKAPPAPAELPAPPPVEYPSSARGDTVDTYFGVEVADPYRWLEDPDSEATQAWIREQNALTRSWLDAVPERGAMKARLQELWNQERFEVPHEAGGTYFYSRNDGLQDQSVLHVATSLDAEPRVLLDPNTLSDDGTVALASWNPSPDGTKLCYALAEAGSDWRTWRIRDVATGEDLPELKDQVVVQHEAASCASAPTSR